MNKEIRSHNGHAPADFARVVDQLLTKPLERFYDDALWGFKDLGRSTHVPVNIRQLETSYEIQIAAAGRSRESFNIRLEGKMLTVSLQTGSEEQPNSPSRWITKEFEPAAFTRTFTVDDTIDTAGITAKYVDGILYLNLPVKEQARPVNRQITIE